MKKYFSIRKHILVAAFSSLLACGAVLPMHAAKADTFSIQATAFGVPVFYSYYTLNFDSGSYVPGQTVAVTGSTWVTPAATFGPASVQLQAQFGPDTAWHYIFNGITGRSPSGFGPMYFTAPSTPGTYGINVYMTVGDGSCVNPWCSVPPASGQINFTVVAPSPVTGVCSGSVNNCAAGDLGATATYPNYPATGQTTYQWWCNGSWGGSNTLCSVTTGVATPYGAINSILPNPCYIARGQTACQPTIGWNTGNTNGAVAINIVNSLGWAPYAAETGYSGYIPTTGSGSWTSLPVGVYNLKLYGQDTTGAWNILDQKGVSVPPPPPATIAASCPAPGTQATFKWSAVAGADEYQIQYTHTAKTPCDLSHGWTIWPGDGTTCYKDPSASSICSAGICSVSVPTVPTGTSVAWVNSANSVIGWGDWNQQPSVGFSCAASAGSFDLTAGPVSLSSTVAHSPVTLSSQITNHGTAGTVSGFKDTFEIHSGSTPPATFAAIDATRGYDSSALAAGGDNIASVSYTFPNPGTYMVRACANMNPNTGNPDLSEANFTDNCSGWQTVTITAAAPACTPACTGGQSCVDTNTCACPAGETLVSGVCTSTGSTCTPACTGGQTCNSGVCGCPAGETLVSGVCSKLPTCTPACTGGQTCNSGTCSCPAGQALVDGVCKASSALPTILSFKVNPNRVRPNGSTAITWQCSSDATSAVVTGQNGFKDNAISGINVNSSTNSGAPLTFQTNFILTCSNSNGSVSSTQTVFILPTVIEQ